MPYYLLNVKLFTDKLLVPVDQEMMEMLQGMPRGLPNVPVFTFQGLAISYIKVGFTKACKRAGIEDFTFHDFRHTYITNKCIEGHHYFRIMAATGHKTMSVFKRYNTVSRDELQRLVGKNR